MVFGVPILKHGRVYKIPSIYRQNILRWKDSKRSLQLQKAINVAIAKFITAQTVLC